MNIINNIRIHIPFYINKRYNIPSNGDFLHFCIIFKRKGKKITPIYTGYNCNRIHAEINAINKIKDEKNVIIFVFRITKTGKLTSSKPCSNCTKKIYENNIKNIYYSENDQNIYMANINNLLKNPHVRTSK